MKPKSKQSKPKPRATSKSLVPPPAAPSLETLVESLREFIVESRRQVVRAVDVIQVQTCWGVGRHIVEFEQRGASRASYGARLIPRLAEALTADFGKGFDASNLRYMRLFYLAFPNCDALRHELSFVIFDLKPRELTHADIGQMDMYVRIFDDQQRGPEDNPTVGIILCAARDASIVRYSVLSENAQLFASRYKLVLPSEEELRLELIREQRLLEEHPSPTRNL